VSSTELRGFRVADIPAAVELINFCHEADGIPSRVTRQRYAELGRDPLIQREKHFLVAESDGALVAFSELFREKGTRLVVPLWVHPDWRQSPIGRRLVERSLGLVTAFPEPALDVPVRPVESWKEALLTDLGFVHVRTWWRMRIDLGPEVPEPAFPSGIALRTFVPGQDEPMLTDLINDVFAEHWGEGQHTLDEIEHDVELPYFDSNLLLLAESNGRPVGYVWSWINHEFNLLIGDPHAFIGDLGVNKPWRGRGLGRALLLHTLREVRRRGMAAAELEVDGPNDSAKHLYESVGFRKHEELRFYRKELRPCRQDQEPSAGP
jgi:mycothiol synthase